ncbi:MAG: M20 family metallopeptidase [Candidatus Acidiferrales bacterium]
MPTAGGYSPEALNTGGRTPGPAQNALANLGALLPHLESVYKDIHSHPELSMREHRTASIAADSLRSAGYDVTTGIGNTGVVGVLRNGEEGPTIMLRADMDALPVREATGLPYASTVTVDEEGKSVPVMHACGHDMHVSWLIGAATILAKNRNSWRGTLMPLFQPAEETGTGAQAMIDDGLFKRFPKPTAILGQHVMVGSSGIIGTRSGVITSAGDSLQVRMFGRGVHGSMPQSSIDPVVMAAATVLRLQTIVSREIAPTDAAVVTIGSLQAGTKENVIPDEAVIKLNVRTFDENVRKRVFAAIERIVNAEAEASRSPKKPEITPLDRYPLVKNDPEATKRAGDAFRSYFLADRVQDTQPTTTSEDFGSFGTEWQVPSVFWFVGGTDPRAYAEAKNAGTIADIPTNHNPRFAPVIHPTLETGVETLVVASHAWLSPDAK